jgi:hypothetical protein
MAKTIILVLTPSNLPLKKLISLEVITVVDDDGRKIITAKSLTQAKLQGLKTA